MDGIKRHFIKEVEKKHVVQYISRVIVENNGDDYALCVTMENSYNTPTTQNAILEYVYVDDRFPTIKEAQIGILVKERFGNKEA